MNIEQGTFLIAALLAQPEDLYGFAMRYAYIMHCLNPLSKNEDYMS